MVLPLFQLMVRDVRYHRMNTGDLATQEFPMCRQQTHAKEFLRPVLPRQAAGTG